MNDGACALVDLVNEVWAHDVADLPLELAIGMDPALIDPKLVAGYPMRPFPSKSVEPELFDLAVGHRINFARAKFAGFGELSEHLLGLHPATIELVLACLGAGNIVGAVEHVVQCEAITSGRISRETLRERRQAAFATGIGPVRRFCWNEAVNQSRKHQQQLRFEPAGTLRTGAA